MKLGDVAQADGYLIEYKVRVPYAPASGETFVNYASLDANKTRIDAKNHHMYIKQLVVQRMVTHLKL